MQRNGVRWWMALPVVVGLVAGLGLQLAAGHRRVFLTFAPGVAVMVLGAVVSAGLLVTKLVRDTNRAHLQQAVVRAHLDGAAAHQRFVRRLDHELKNPLTALLAALDGSPDGVDGVRAREQAERLRRLLGDLRRVADIETVALDLARVEIGSLVREATGWALADADDARRVRIDVPSAPRPLPLVWADPDLLGVAVYNVVSNALKHAGPGVAVEIRVRELAGRPPAVVIEVADAGVGMSAGDAHEVWEELFRGRNSTGTPGSGIGLALVRAIVERHGGFATLSSEPGGGTSVLLRLPAGVR